MSDYFDYVDMDGQQSVQNSIDRFLPPPAIFQSIALAANAVAKARIVGVKRKPNSVEKPKPKGIRKNPNYSLQEWNIALELINNGEYAKLRILQNHLQSKGLLGKGTSIIRKRQL